ncbi:hypothetical protein BD626DRAFT_453466 [Schizophyllum amplum]|uniref:Uncharacterized protein n=1 Tax=Schizophyllum amplum TaxID=97359 RepID=A0A550CN19_9AGAR|nr:hypothetical protein BD626DRAFT_453466 [Auriculariopsis ampla]
MFTPTSWKDPERPTHKSSASLETSASGIAESTISFSGLNNFPLPPPSAPATPTDVDPGSTPVKDPARPRANSRQAHAPSTQTAMLSPLAAYPASPLTPQYPDSATKPLISRPTSRIVTDHEELTNDAYYAELSAAGAVPLARRSIAPGNWHDEASSIDVDAAEDNLLSTSFITSLLREVTPASPRFRDSGSGKSAGSRQSNLSEMTYPPRRRAHTEREVIPRVPQSTLMPPSKEPSSTLKAPAADGPSSDNDSDIQSSIGHLPVIKQASFTRPHSLSGSRVVGIAPATLLSRSSQLSSSMTTDAARDSGVLLPQDVTEDEADVFGPHSSTSVLNEPYSSRAVSPGHHPPLPYQQSRLHRRAASAQSAKSYVTSVVSSFSRRSTRSVRRLYARLANKPLPPLPGQVQLRDTDSTYRKEATMPLPQLIDRAGALRGMLEKGHLAHYSYDTARMDQIKRGLLVVSPTSPDMRTYDPHHNHQTHYFESTGVNPWQTTGAWRSQANGQGALGNDVDQLPSPSKELRPPLFALASSPRKRRLYILGAILLVMALALGIGLGVGLQKHERALPDCGNVNVTGMACNLDATCECTATSGCNGLAQEIVRLTPLVNDAFQTDFTIAGVFNSFWVALGTSSSGSCIAQALVVDVAEGLDPVTASNRTAWAQMAILWNLVQSQDVATAQGLKDFVNGADWTSLSNPDGPMTDSDYPTFSTTVSGFTFNFATQQVTEPSVSFVSNAQPITQQANKPNDDAKATLDRMYSYALASATQQASALKTYWTNVLQLAGDDLPTFISLFLSADILLPFDAEGAVISQLNGTDASTPFPPPLACYPSLTDDNIRRVNSFESSAFGLSTVSSASEFDRSCYATRPVYGILDILRLRLPFVDARSSAPKQGMKLNRNAGVRAIMYTGEVMSAMPGANVSDLTDVQANPRLFGTLNHYDHVILHFLQSITDVSVATDFVRFLLTAPGVPPSNTTSLFSSLDKIPTVEVAVFGTVDASDLDNAVSSFSTDDGGLFFGSAASKVFRDWTVTTASKPIKWTETAGASQIVVDDGNDDTIFNEVWAAATTAVEQNVENVGVDDVVASLQSTGEFTAG